MIASWIVKRMIVSSFNIMSQDHIDIGAVLKSYADDCVYGATSEAGEGTVKGKKALTDWFQNWEKEYPKRTFEIRNIAFAAWPFMPTNVVMIDWTLTRVNREGKVFRHNGYSVCYMKRYKMVRGHDYMVSCGPSLTLNPD